MSKAKRWAIWCYATHGHDLMMEVEGGDYVLASDYDALVAKLEGLVKQWEFEYETVRRSPFQLDIQRIIEETK